MVFSRYQTLILRQKRIFGGKVKIAQKLLRFLQNLSGKIANQIRKKGQIVSKTFDFVIK